MLGVAIIPVAILIAQQVGRAIIGLGMIERDAGLPDGVENLLDGVLGLIVFAVVGGGFCAAGYSARHARWTDDLLKAIESRLPKRKPRSHPLSELAKAAKQGSLERAKLFVEDR